jgi:hypothetical protein
MGYGMAGPAVMTHACRELAAELLWPDYACDEIWWRLFSAPGTGSDLAPCRGTAGSASPCSTPAHLCYKRALSDAALEPVP